MISFLKSGDLYAESDGSEKYVGINLVVENGGIKHYTVLIFLF